LRHEPSAVLPAVSPNERTIAEQAAIVSLLNYRLTN
jgi:hypothetical protein